MTTMSVPIAAAGDDGSYDIAGGFYAYPMVQTGSHAATAFLRFVGLTIPAGSTITSATLMLTPQVAQTSPFPATTISASAEDNAAAPTSYTGASGFANRVATSASAAWTPSGWALGTSYTSTDLSAVIQEVIDRAGWASGNALMLFWNPPTSGKTLFANGYEQGTGLPTLAVGYSSSEDEAGAATFSGEGTLTVTGVASFPPGAPALISPADGATVSTAVMPSWTSDGTQSAYAIRRRRV